MVRRNAYGCWMASEAWQQVRRRWAQEWRLRFGDDPVCAVCGAAWSLESGDLHHHTYRRIGHERFEDLVPCDRTCHDQIHTVIEADPAWRRLDRAYASYLIVALLRQQVGLQQ